MVKSDLVTSFDGTISFLFFSVANLLNRRGKSRENFTGTKKAILLATGLFVYCCILVKCADIKRCLRGDCSEEDEDDDEKSLA